LTARSGNDYYTDEFWMQWDVARLPTLQDIDEAIAKIDALIAARAASSTRSLRRLQHRDPTGMMSSLHSIENNIDDIRALKRARRMVLAFRARGA
jgi:uncharacterized protein HemX